MIRLTSAKLSLSTAGGTWARAWPHRIAEVLVIAWRLLEERLAGYIVWDETLGVHTFSISIFDG